MPSATHTSKWPALLALLLLVACASFVTQRLVRGGAIGTNIQSILPEQALAPDLRDALQSLSDQGSNQIALLVTSKTSDAYQDAAKDLRARLADATLLSDDADRNQSTGRWIFENRAELLCEQSPDAFDTAAAEAVHKQALASVYGVGAPITGDLLKQDPFLLTLHLTDCLLPAPQVPARAELITGTLTQSAFSTITQANLTDVLSAWHTDWADKDVRLTRSGAVFHAAESAASAKSEMTFIGGLGLIGVVILFWLAFGNMRSVLVVIALIASAFAFGLAATLLIFGEIHVLALVFSAMLVGVVADYGVHTMGAGVSAHAPTPASRRAVLLRPMTVSMLTTSTGFTGLIFLGVAIFQQLAVTAIVGVASAWALILFVYVPLTRARADGNAKQARWQTTERLANSVFSKTHVSIGLAIALGALTLLGMVRAVPLDNVRQFQPRDDALIQEEADLQTVLGRSASQILFISEGDTLEAAKRNEEALLASLPKGTAVMALTRFDPSQRRRAENRAALQDRLETPYLNEHRASLGLPAPAPHEAPETSSHNELPNWLTGLQVQTPQSVRLIAQLDAGAIPEGTKTGNGRTIDLAASYSRAFARYRILAGKAICVAILIALLFVVLVYRRLAALSIVLAPAAAMLGGLFIPAAFGVPLSFFSMAGAMVLFGVGIDYSAFMWEAGPKREDWTKASVLIGALTTLLSMGLMGFSETFPVHSFGITVTTGVICALIYSTVPYSLAKRDKTK